MVIGALTKRASAFYFKSSVSGTTSVPCSGAARLAQRKPSQLFVFVGLSSPRFATPAGPGVFQEPPRDTRIVFTVVKSSINA